jgi:hypothetical protein
VAGLEDLVVGADADAGEVLTVVVAAGRGHGTVDDVVDDAQGEGVVEEVAEQFVDAAQRAVADEDQAEGQLVQPSLGDGKVKEDGAVLGVRVEGVSEGLLRFVGLLVDELAADVMGGGEVADGLCAGEGVEGQMLALVRRESFGGDGGGGGLGAG